MAPVKQISLASNVSTTFLRTSKVWVDKDAYSNGAYTKSHSLYYGPFKIIDKIGWQSYKLALSRSLGRYKYTSFNIKALKSPQP